MIILEGIDGVGKTTISKLFEENFSFVTKEKQLKINYDKSVVESNKFKKEIEQVENKVERNKKFLFSLSSEKER